MAELDKVERYDWAKLGDEGKIRKVNINELQVDLNYRRGEVSKFNTLTLARNFCWDAFGVPVVMERDNGELYVVDGQQRILALRQRNFKGSFFVKIFKSNGIDHEARAFRTMQMNRNSVRAYLKFKSAIVAKEEPELTISKTMDGMGFKIVDDSKTSLGINFTTLLVNTWKVSKDDCLNALLIQKEIIGEFESFNAHCHQAIFYLLRNKIDVRKFIDKIIKSGGKIYIIKEIKAVAIELKQQVSFRVAGIGLLRIINNKLNHKIKLKAED